MKQYRKVATFSHRSIKNQTIKCLAKEKVSSGTFYKSKVSDAILSNRTFAGLSPEFTQMGYQ